MVKHITDSKFAKSHPRSICLYVVMESAFGKQIPKTNSPTTLTALPTPKALLGEVLDKAIANDWSFVTVKTERGMSIFRVRMSKQADFDKAKNLFEVLPQKCHEPGCVACFMTYYHGGMYEKWAQALGHL